MSMTIKMLDATGKGFRLVSVGEPVDIQVISGDEPRIVVHQAITSLSRGFPLVNNAYIMNAAGDTISKIDYKEVKTDLTIQQNHDHFQESIFCNLEEGIKDQAIGHILRNAHGHQVVVMVEHFPGGETIYVMLEGRFSRSYTPGRGIVMAVELSRDKCNELELQLKHCVANYTTDDIKSKCTFFDVRLSEGKLVFSPWLAGLSTPDNIQPLG